MKELLHDRMADGGGVVYSSGRILFLEAACTDDKREHYCESDEIIEPGHHAGDRLNSILCFLGERMAGIFTSSPVMVSFLFDIGLFPNTLTIYTNTIAWAI